MGIAGAPDFDALICYAIVALAGLITALVQVQRRVGQYKGGWLALNTWVLACAYMLVPLALFWILDLTGALHDTSLMAAITIGLGYTAILEGGSKNVQAPAEISGLWQPFLKWADSISVKIRERTFRRQERLKELVVAKLVMDATKFSALSDLVESRGSEAEAVHAQFSAIDARAGQLGTKAVLDKKARILYLAGVSIPDFDLWLKDNGVVGKVTYFWRFKGLSDAVLLGLVGVILLLGIRTGVRWAMHPEQRIWWHAWRVRKLNTTDWDLFRAREQLRGALANPITNTLARERLMRTLQVPNLPMERVQAIITLLLADRDSPSVPPETFPGHLIEALRCGSVDARTRINQALIFIAKERQKEVDKDLVDWKPSEGDSSTELERRVSSWKQVFQSKESQVKPDAPKVTR